MKIGHLRWKGVVLGLATLSIVVAGFTSLAFARHGEEDILTNRIPEPAPYVVEETTHPTLGSSTGVAQPPYEGEWASNSTAPGGCTGCHGTLYNEWNGSMMSNAWRDPGWRGAFLLVARATSTDGNADIPSPPDGTPTATINPFAQGNQSVYNVVPGTMTPFPGVTAATYSGSGSLMDDFCSRCHMPTNYVDGTREVYRDNQSPYGAGTSTQEHGRISPLYDPTSTGTASYVDPAYPTQPAVLESFGERSYVDGGATRVVNSNSGKVGIQCEVCHTNVASRYTPYHFYNKTAQSGEAEYFPALNSAARSNAANNLTVYQQDMLDVPDATSKNLGYGIGAGAFRLSPHALLNLERFGPFSQNDPCLIVNADPSTPLVCSGNQVLDPYVGSVFGTSVPLLQQQARKHDAYRSVKVERSEFCGSCHDVTNPMTIKNPAGKWVGGFPIERTYTEFRNSRYADRPSNPYFDPAFKRDCMTCHMQQDYGNPGTALTLYQGGTPVAPLVEPSCDSINHDPGYSHHFVGGNSYMPRLIGAAANNGTAAAYPQLLQTSFSSADPASRFHYARYANPSNGSSGRTHHERMVWDRLRNVLTMNLTAPATATPGGSASVTVSVTNEGSGHNFPTGFPEGRAAWIRITAVDTKGNTNPNDDVTIYSQGDLTQTDVVDTVNYPANCPNAEGSPTGWLLPAGSIEPNAYALRAMATVDGTCPTLDLPYATPVNLVTNANGLPIDASGVVIDRNNPTGIPRYGNDPNAPEQFRGAFLYDTRLGPQRAGGNTYATATRAVSIPIPSNAIGPIAVTGAVYYQAFEGIVARKFLGNLANTDDTDANEGHPGGHPTLEPCVLNGACDRENKAGIRGEAELREAMKFDPIVVEGAPPVPMKVKTAAIRLATDTQPPAVVINNSNVNTNIVSEPIPASRHWSPSPYGGATGNYAAEGVGETNVDPYRIAKVTFNEPVQGVGPTNLYLTTSAGAAVNTFLDQIGDSTYALFPYVAGLAGKVTLSANTTYVIHVVGGAGGGITDYAGNALPTGPASGSQYTFGFTVGTNVPIDPNQVPLGGGTPPNAPTNLAATDAGTGGAINLTWTPSTSSGVTEQRVKRSTVSGGPYTLVTTIANNTTSSYGDSGLTNGTTYYYVVTAYDGTQALESANSNQSSATPSGGGGGDAAPAVSAVDPPNGATNVSRNPVVTVTFTEPVVVTSTGITLNVGAGGGGNPCGTLGAAVSGTVGGTGSVWTFTPGTTLGSRVSYCVTVVAVQVSDVDTIDPPDNMLANFVSTFKTAR